MTDDVPTWVRALQAALIGLVAGLALHALFSLVVLHGDSTGQKPPGASQCKKASPPPPATTTTGVSRVSALRGPILGAS